MQSTSHILMIRPVNFGFNAETAVNNLFQVPTDQTSAQENAVQEFDNLVAILRKNEIDVTVVQDSPEPYTPDSIFPNNWISFLENGTIFLYPMFAQNRRAERKESVLEEVNQKFFVNNRVDLTFYESQNLFLEGTGSMVLDRDHKIAYACLSQRTDKTIKVCYLLIQISKNESVNKAIKSSPIKKINKTANHIREKALNNKKLKDSKDIQMKFSQNIEESSGFIENSIAQSQINEEQQSRLRILLKNESYKNEHEDDSNENMNNNDINK